MHPFSNLAERYFWSSAVAKRNMFDIDELWDPKFPVAPRDRVATFGSCFAQHIGRALAGRGFNWLITEQAPRGLSEDDARKFNYGVFSARTGNIYTVSLLKQWVGWACGDSAPPGEAWEKDGRFYDPFRPNIEPDGFASAAEMVASRGMAIDAFRDCLASADVFVFTLGLTESWFQAQEGYEYPMCPGTLAGTFDATRHKFVNQDYALIAATLLETLRKIRALNPKIRFLLTVSPVPLTATASGNHVLVATMESKSILRAVAGHVARELEFADYFPSYEIINSAPFRGTFFEPNLRSVHQAGVDHVMENFFRCLERRFPRMQGEAPAQAAASAHTPAQAERRPAAKARKRGNAAAPADAAVREARRLKRLERQQLRARRKKGGGAAAKRPGADVVCEEELLSAFAKK